MVVEVSGRDLLEALNSLCGAKQVINFSAIGNQVVLQAFDPIISDEPIQILKVVKLDAFKEISVELNTAYNIIDEQDTVTLTITDKVMIIETNGFSSMYNAVFDKRMNIEEMIGSEVYQNIGTQSLRQIARATTSVINVARSLKVNEPAVIIRDGFAYMQLSEIACRIPTDFPNCVLSIGIVRALSALFEKNHISTVTLEVERTNGNFCIIRNLLKGRAVAFTMKYENGPMPLTVNTAINECQSVTKIDFTAITQKAKIAQQTFKQIIVLCCIGKGIGVTITKDVSNRLQFGYKAELGDNFIIWKTTIVILNAVTRIFGDGQVSVKKGGRYLCLQNSQITLLLTGVS